MIARFSPNGVHTQLLRAGVLGVGIFLFMALVLHKAGVMEDPYITFRVVDNFLKGYGLTWNTDERVQVYTHPLWMFLHIPFYALWDNIYYITIVIGLICTLVALLLPLATFPQVSALAYMVLFLAPLAASNSFVKYSTSGFENSLTHALFGWFVWVLFRAKEKHFWLLASLSTSLALVNRLDVVIVYAPVWLYLLATRFKTVRWKQLFLGALPIVGWEIFSLFYYGFLFPNTKYAKLNTGLEQSEYWRFGISYALNYLAVEPISALFVLGAVVLIPWLAWRRLRHKDDSAGIGCALSLGVLITCVYVVYVGGTYLSGRLLTLPLYASVCFMLQGFFSFSGRMLAVVLAACLLLEAYFPSPPVLRKVCPPCFMGVDPLDREEGIPLRAALDNKDLLPKADVNLWGGWNYTVAGSIGRWGFAMKRRIRIIDNIALADPLLARLPARSDKIISTGAFTRKLPVGYVRARVAGNLVDMDPDLAEYYRMLRIIVSGPLWDSERLATIVRFNMGYYDIYRQQFLDRAADTIRD